MRPPVLPYERSKGQEETSPTGTATLLCGTLALGVSLLAPLFQVATFLSHPANRVVLLAGLLALTLSLLAIVSAVRYIIRHGTDNARVLIGLVLSIIASLFPLNVIHTLLGC